VDRYGDTLVAQFLSAGAERWKDVLADALLAATGCSRLYERSDASVRGTGRPAPQHRLAARRRADRLTITEHGWQLGWTWPGPQDRLLPGPARQPRRALREWVRRLGCQRVLNCYCYTGGFSVAALAGGAQQVTSVDSSGPGAGAWRPTWRCNGFDAGAQRLSSGRRRQRLPAPGLRPAGASTPSCWTRPSSRPPPRMPNAPRAPTRTSTAWRSSCWRRAGVLFTFHAQRRHQRRPVPQDRGRCRAGCRAWTATSCSGWGAAPDHPTTIEFPEGEYLKGLVVVRNRLWK
jgi:23S rRNA (cytosine1962-C5)-methyltransferase